MPDKRKNQKKANTLPLETGVFEVRDPVDSMESVVTSINVRINGVVKDVARLKASLEFIPKELSDHAEKIKSIEDNVSKIAATMKKDIEKTVYLEDQSRRNNLRFEGLYWKMTMKHGMKRKRKLRMTSQKTRF